MESPVRRVRAACGAVDQPGELPISLVGIPVRRNRADALMAERLTAEPLLLTRAAEALRRNFAALPDKDVDEFGELGGSDRLDAEDKRLVAITLLESVLVDPEGETVAGRLRVAWRF